VEPQTPTPQTPTPQTPAPQTLEPQTLEPQTLELPSTDLPMVPFAVTGMVIWAIAIVVVLPFRETHESWFWICVAGFLWGIPGLLAMIRHDANRRRRRAALPSDR
jgi:hypothetical protein